MKAERALLRGGPRDGQWVDFVWAADFLGVGGDDTLHFPANPDVVYFSNFPDPNFEPSPVESYRLEKEGDHYVGIHQP